MPFLCYPSIEKKKVKEKKGGKKTLEWNLLKRNVIISKQTSTQTEIFKCN